MVIAILPWCFDRADHEYMSTVCMGATVYDLGPDADPWREALQ